ncbi:hypothetical protein C2I36_05645 [Rhodobacteraceae bacterium WD3A24]|nr:hypothetical protein C2I36_05645 [Rhodobacteraceae bacterium WD3A24]
MTDTTAPSPRSALLPLFAAGLAGEAVFEILALIVAPAVLGTPMMPAMLVAGLGGSIFGATVPMPLAWALHLLAGAVVFPLGYLALCRAMGARSWVLPGLVWALILWVIAQGLLAPMVGRPFMLGFIPYTWASLAVHAAYSLTVAAVFYRLATGAGRGG